jgi:hypothetical protein
MTIKMPKNPKRKPTKKTQGGPTSGPVTLAEARALAQAEQPKRALRKSSTAAASPEGVGIAREKLQQTRREEIAGRVREYKATMAIMKKRGARRTQGKGAAKTKGDEPLTDGAAFEPLQIFAEGDSWFKYPVPLFGGSIIPRLEDRLGVPILNLAKAGDEVRYMLGVEERTILAEHLGNGCPAGGPWDALMFSGGGNDIVGDPMALWIKDWNATVAPSGHIHQARFDSALALVRAGYEDLIAMRDKLSPNTHLVFHCYDFAIPDGRGICHLGPWLKPTFDLKEFPTRAAASDVVRAMLQQFALVLESLAASPKVTFINGQGTLVPKTSSWHNELHPSQQGFEKFADIFYSQLKTLFPARVA